MNKYRLVEQENEWGCGVACVASLLGIEYDAALKRLEHHKKGKLDEKPLGLDIHEIIWSLSDHDLWYIADWRRPAHFPVGSIVCIRGKAPYQDDHYLLMTPHGWMDPWHNTSKNVSAIKADYREAFPIGTEFIVALMPQEP